MLYGCAEVLVRGHVSGSRDRSSGCAVFVTLDIVQFGGCDLACTIPSTVWKLQKERNVDDEKTLPSRI